MPELWDGSSEAGLNPLSIKSFDSNQVRGGTPYYYTGDIKDIFGQCSDSSGLGSKNICIINSPYYFGCPVGEKCEGSNIERDDIEEGKKSLQQIFAKSYGAWYWDTGTGKCDSKDPVEKKCTVDGEVCDPLNDPPGPCILSFGSCTGIEEVNECEGGIRDGENCTADPSCGVSGSCVSDVCQEGNRAGYSCEGDVTYKGGTETITADETCWFDYDVNNEIDVDDLLSARAQTRLNEIRTKSCKSVETGRVYCEGTIPYPNVICQDGARTLLDCAIPNNECKEIKVCSNDANKICENDPECKTGARYKRDDGWSDWSPLDMEGSNPEILGIEVDGKSADVTITKNGFVNLTFTTDVNDNQEPLVMYKVDWGDGETTVVSGVEMRDRPDINNPHSLYHLYDYWDLKNKNSQGVVGIDCGTPEECKITPSVKIKDNWGLESDLVLFSGKIIVKER